jgi:hypothetical protein
MRRYRALGVGLLCVLILEAAVPAHAAPRDRLYRGLTSQEERIRFIVAKHDAGRFVRSMDVRPVLTCEDQTTEEFGFGIGFGGQVPITDRAFSFDQLLGNMAIHLAGELGRLQGQGTLRFTMAALTADEQAQLCTTGDLTWEVEFVRTIPRTRVDAPGIVRLDATPGRSTYRLPAPHGEPVV